MIRLPIHTERLAIRLMDLGDAEALSAYRSLPDVAEHQSWEAPYSVEQARALIAGQAHLVGPTPGEWVQLAVDHAGDVVGDVAVHLSDDGSTAEIGYSLHTAHQGRGFASEAAGAVVDALVASGAHRVEAGVDPRNHASRRVLERLGFRLEGCAREAYRGTDGWLDDERWALLAADRVAWVRPPAPPAEVHLVELTGKARAFARLQTHPTQRRYVATVADSYADALFPDLDDAGGRLVPWLRGVEADGVPAGFVMTAEPSATNPEPYLWRLLIDRDHQRRGIGERVIDELVARYRAQGHTTLLTSWVDLPGGPGPFYARLGFVPTGKVEEGEVEGRLRLDEWASRRGLG